MLKQIALKEYINQFTFNKTVHILYRQFIIDKSPIGYKEQLH